MERLTCVWSISKSGGKEFLLSDVLNGLNMQMLIYLMCLWQNGAQRYGEVVPAGILYMPVKSTPATLGRNATQAEIDKARAKACRMSGMVLDHSLVIDGMEDDGKGIFIPVRREKDGGVKGTLINLTQLSRLQKKDGWHFNGNGRKPTSGRNWRCAKLWSRIRPRVRLVRL